MEYSSILASLKVTPDYNVEEIIEKEFHRVEGQCYLDHAGAALYSEGQMGQVMKELSHSLLGNPHSRHVPSDSTSQYIEAARHRILEHFNTTAEEYDLIFTSGATASLRLIAEYFDWNNELETQPQDSTEGTTETREESQKSKGKQTTYGNLKETTELMESQNHTEKTISDSSPETTDPKYESQRTKDEISTQNSLKETTELIQSRKYKTTHTETTELQNCRENLKDESRRGVFVYVQENHTSVLGMRGPACDAGCDVYCITTSETGDRLKGDLNRPVADNDLPLTSVNNNKEMSGNDNPGTTNAPKSLEDPHASQTKRVNCLFAYSAQCNFSGSKSPLEWIRKVQEGGLNDLLSTQPINSETLKSYGANRGSCVNPKWFVVLDAAGLVATSPLDLSRWKPDFVPMSFYKIFGYPSGLGCLLVNRRAWGVLGRAYQGGGTVLMLDSRRMLTVPRRTLHERFEDGTLPYLSIPALRHGLDTIHRLTGGMPNIESHVYHLARYTHHTLRSMRHRQRTPVAHLYLAEGDTWLPNTHGPIINFNLMNPDGSYVGFSQVERVASLYNIHLRTGCLCNPGACQSLLNITQDKLISQFKAGHVCGDSLDIVDGEPTGSVRVSFGYSSTYGDADLLLRMIQECFVDKPVTFDLTWMKGEVDLSWIRSEEDGGGMEGVEVMGKNDGKGEWKRNGMDEEGTETKDGKGERESGIDEGMNERINKEQIRDTKRKKESSEKNLRERKSNGMDEEGMKTKYDAKGVRKSGIDGLKKERINKEWTRDAKGEEESDGKGLKERRRCRLTDIVVYPIKSCAGVRVRSWWVGERGLWLDRRWMVVNREGRSLTQKKVPAMTLITPRFDLEREVIVLSYEGVDEELQIQIEPEEGLDTSGAALCDGRVCGVSVQGLDCGLAAGEWLSDVLGITDLRLIMQTGHRKGSSGESVSFANEAQYVITHRPSIRSLMEEINARGLEELTEEELVERFRGNFVVDGGEAYEEDSWDTLMINNTTLQIQGGCSRCQMVSVVPGSGQRTREPMLSLTSTRGAYMLFGVYASAYYTAEDEGSMLCVGATVHVTRS